MRVGTSADRFRSQWPRLCYACRIIRTEGRQDMPVRASSIDRGRVAEAAAWASCAVLGALVLWLFVRMAWSLVPRGDAAFDSAPIGNAGSAVQTAAPSVARWHLFGTAPAQPGSGPGAPSSTLTLALRGTFAGRDPADGIAVIENAGEGERAWRVGEDVLPGVRLAAVHADRVVLSRNGVEETLVLPRDTQLAPADIVRVTPGRVGGGATVGPAGPAASAGATPAKAVPTAPLTLEQVRRDPEALMRRVQVVPVLSDGKLAGVRFSAGTDVALLEQVGLQQGDVVTAVNGMAVDSVERGRQIMDSLGDANSVRVTVLRNGKPTEITVGLR
jgi:general secretion pathway protein C